MCTIVCAYVFACVLCIHACLRMCVCALCMCVAVWCSGCVLDTGPEVSSSSSTLAILHLVFQPHQSTQL